MPERKKSHSKANVRAKASDNATTTGMDPRKPAKAAAKPAQSRQIPAKGAPAKASKAAADSAAEGMRRILEMRRQQREKAANSGKSGFAGDGRNAGFRDRERFRKFAGPRRRAA